MKTIPIALAVTPNIFNNTIKTEKQPKDRVHAKFKS